MKKFALVLLSVFPYLLSAQYISGYYISLPAVQDFHHFNITNNSDQEGVFTLQAFIDNSVVLEQDSETIDVKKAEDFIQKYGEGKEIQSVNKITMNRGGKELEIFFLGYLDNRDQGRFIVVEEVFNDESKKTTRGVSTKA